MARIFTVDLSDYYGQPDFREQDSSTIVDRRKTLNLHKELEAGKATEKKLGAKGKSSRARKGAGTNCKPGGAIAFKGAVRPAETSPTPVDAALPLAEHKGGAIAFNSSDKGGALAFNEQQLMNELTGLKKGGAFGTVAATVIPALIQMAPQIISSIKDLVKGRQGGAIKFGGASTVFLNGIDPSKYDDVLKTMKAIEKQSKNIEVRGGALYAGSSRVGTFFKNAWNKIKSWYDNNADKLKPITDILVNECC